MSSPKTAHIADILLALIPDIGLHLLGGIRIFLLEVLLHKTLILGSLGKLSQ